MSKKVHIVGFYGNAPYAYLFEAYGWGSATLEGSDLLLFTGGSDVNPASYHQPIHDQTQLGFSLDKRDETEFYVASYHLGSKPMVGICRGAQLLNVVNGGKLYQDVGGHMSSHEVTTIDGQQMTVPSDHHQMMIPTGIFGCDVLMWKERDVNWAPKRETWHDGGWSDPYSDSMHDIEAVCYKGTKTLCFQSHPEYCQPGGKFPNFFFQELDRMISNG